MAGLMGHLAAFAAISHWRPLFSAKRNPSLCHAFSYRNLHLEYGWKVFNKVNFNDLKIPSKNDDAGKQATKPLTSFWKQLAGISSIIESLSNDFL
jgi:hypothetical protein